MKITLNSLFNYDKSLFNNIELNNYIDKDVMVSVILEKCGEFPLLYPDIDYMKYAINLFFKKHKNTFDKWSELYQLEYNPLHNYDRHEEYSDDDNLKATSKTSGTSESKVSAFNDFENSNTYQPSSKNIGDNSGTTESKKHSKHEAHLYGNIGVTTSMELWIAQFDLVKINIYEEIAKLFADDYCIKIY